MFGKRKLVIKERKKKKKRIIYQNTKHLSFKSFKTTIHKHSKTNDCKCIRKTKTTENNLKPQINDTRRVPGKIDEKEKSEDRKLIVGDSVIKNTTGAII